MSEKKKENDLERTLYQTCGELGLKYIDFKREIGDKKKWRSRRKAILVRPKINTFIIYIKKYIF